MDKQQFIMLDLIRSAIENGNPHRERFLDADWDTLYQESLDHHITTFIFPPVDKLYKEGLVPDTIYEKMKTQAIITGLRYEQLIYDFSSVLKGFNEAGIPVLCFKGVVLRSIYPHPEYRTMGDADILVHKEHLEKAEEILLKYGYVKIKSHDIHYNFAHPLKLQIELHWTMVNEVYIKSTEYIAENAWKNAISTTICGVPAQTLRPEDHLLYLFLHMAVHLVFSGFGLRQIIDVAVFLKSIYETADWNYLNNILKISSMERFAKAVFYICNRYFGVELPELFSNFTEEEKSYSESLLEDAFTSGVFGKRTQNNKMTMGLTHNQNQVKYTSQFMYYVHQLFPGKKEMSEKYKILTQAPILLPFVWLYRIIASIYNKDMTVEDKIIQSSAYKKRSQLIGWLNIK